MSARRRALGRGRAYALRMLAPRSAAPAILLLLAAGLAGCASSLDPPVTPEERAYAARKAREELRKDSGVEEMPQRCAGSTMATRFEGRRTRYQAVDGFDTQGCPP